MRRVIHKLALLVERALKATQHSVESRDQLFDFIFRPFEFKPRIECACADMLSLIARRYAGNLTRGLPTNKLLSHPEPL